MSLARIKAMARSLRDYPPITEEDGDHILDNPEGFIEDAMESGMPDGFDDFEQLERFMSLYATFRWSITNDFADRHGHDVVAKLIQGVHAREKAGAGGFSFTHNGDGHAS